MGQLADHIKKLNAETQAWVDAEPGRWAGMLVEDEAHWNEYGVYTPAQFDRYMDEATYSDVYKEKYGMRPRPNWSEISDAELKKMLEDL